MIQTTWIDSESGELALRGKNRNAMRRRFFIRRGHNDFPEALAALCDTLRGEPWLRRCFEPFLLEEVPTVARPRSLQ